MTNLVGLIILILIAIFYILFYSPPKKKRRRTVAPSVTESRGDSASGPFAGVAVDIITEVPAAAVADAEPEPELVLDMQPAAETPPVGAAQEEIPFIDGEQRGPLMNGESEITPALAGLGGDSGSFHAETPQDLAERLDFFFGDTEAGEGHVAEESAGREDETVQAGEGGDFGEIGKNELDDDKDKTITGG